MSLFTALQRFHLFNWSQPASDRPLYRLAEQGQFRRLLEVGIGNGQRALQMLNLALERVPPKELLYVGIDAFEAGPGPQRGPLKLQDAYKMFRATGVGVRLMPGDVLTGLQPLANLVKDIDLVLISANQPADSLAQAWYFLPRMLAPQSRVFVEEISAKKVSTLREIAPLELARLATRRGKSKAA